MLINKALYVLFLLQVSKSHPKVLSPAIVEELMDRQSTAFAQRVISQDVEKIVRENGDQSTAHFIKAFRQWYEAIDMPGISAHDRVERLVKMRVWLLNKVRFDTFPPPGSHVKGFSLTWYEGMMHNIDTRLQLYGLLPGGYCQRSIGTLAAESFFGDLTEMDQTKLGCPKAIHIPRLISTVTEINHYRHNPDER